MKKTKTKAKSLLAVLLVFTLNMSNISYVYGAETGKENALSVEQENVIEGETESESEVTVQSGEAVEAEPKNEMAVQPEELEIEEEVNIQSEEGTEKETEAESEVTVQSEEAVEEEPENEMAVQPEALEIEEEVNIQSEEGTERETEAENEVTVQSDEAVEEEPENEMAVQPEEPETEDEVNRQLEEGIEEETEPESEVIVQTEGAVEIEEENETAEQREDLEREKENEENKGEKTGIQNEAVIQQEEAVGAESDNLIEEQMDATEIVGLELLHSPYETLYAAGYPANDGNDYVGLEIEVHFADGSTEILNSGDSTTQYGQDLIYDTSLVQWNQAGVYSVSISYGNYEVSYDVEVVNPEVITLTSEMKSIHLNAENSRMVVFEFIPEEDGNYLFGRENVNGSVRWVRSYAENEDGSWSSDSYTSQGEYLKLFDAEAGKYYSCQYEVYDEYDADVYIKMPEEIVEINVIQQPDRDSYTTAMINDGLFDMSGLVVEVRYANGSSNLLYDGEQPKGESGGYWIEGDTSQLGTVYYEEGWGLRIPFKIITYEEFLDTVSNEFPTGETQYIDIEGRNTIFYKYTPEESGTYEFSAIEHIDDSSYRDLYRSCVYNVSDELLYEEYQDTIQCKFEAGKTYIIVMVPYDDATSIEARISYAKEVDSIEISTPPKTIYALNEWMELSDMEIIVHYVDGSTEVVREGPVEDGAISGYWQLSDGRYLDVYSNDFNPSIEGIYELLVELRNGNETISTSINLEVRKKAIVRFDLMSEPSTTIYPTIAKDIDYTGMDIEIEYEDGSYEYLWDERETLDAGYSVEYDLSGVNFSVPGSYPVIIKCEGFEASFDIYIIESEVIEIVNEQQEIEASGDIVYLKYTADETKGYIFKIRGEYGEYCREIYDDNWNDIMLSNNGGGDGFEYGRAMLEKGNSYYLMIDSCDIGKSFTVELEKYFPVKTAEILQMPDNPFLIEGLESAINLQGLRVKVTFEDNSSQILYNGEVLPYNRVDGPYLGYSDTSAVVSLYYDRTVEGQSIQIEIPMETLSVSEALEKLPELTIGEIDEIVLPRENSKVYKIKPGKSDVYGISCKNGSYSIVDTVTGEWIIQNDSYSSSAKLEDKWYFLVVSPCDYSYDSSTIQISFKNLYDSLPEEGISEDKEIEIKDGSYTFKFTPDNTGTYMMKFSHEYDGIECFFHSITSLYSENEIEYRTESEMEYGEATTEHSRIYAELNAGETYVVELGSYYSDFNKKGSFTIKQLKDIEKISIVKMPTKTEFLSDETPYIDAFYDMEVEIQFQNGEREIISPNQVSAEGISLHLQNTMTETFYIWYGLESIPFNVSIISIEELLERAEQVPVGEDVLLEGEAGKYLVYSFELEEPGYYDLIAFDEQDSNHSITSYNTLFYDAQNNQLPYTCNRDYQEDQFVYKIAEAEQSPMYLVVDNSQNSDSFQQSVKLFRGNQLKEIRIANPDEVFFDQQIVGTDLYYLDLPSNLQLEGVYDKNGEEITEELYEYSYGWDHDFYAAMGKPGVYDIVITYLDKSISIPITVVYPEDYEKVEQLEVNQTYHKKVNNNEYFLGKFTPDETKTYYMTYIDDDEYPTGEIRILSAKGDLIEYFEWYFDEIGKPRTVEVSLEKGRDYYIAVKTSAREFDFSPIPENFTAVLKEPSDSMVYNGKEHKPAVEVRLSEEILEEGVDYIVQYYNNVNASSEAYVEVSPIGDMEFPVRRLYFTINPKDISELEIEDIPDQAIGEPIEIVLRHGDYILEEDKDYWYNLYYDQIEGWGEVEIYGIGNYTGSLTKKFTISGENLNIINYVLNGGNNHNENPEVYYGDVVLKAPEKEGYTFKGWYSDSDFSKEITTIEKNSGTVTVYAKWEKVELTKPSITEIKDTDKGVQVVFENIKDADGYELQYAEDNNFSVALKIQEIKENEKVVLSDLKKGQKYYIRIRAYQIDSTNKKVYSGFSAVESYQTAPEIVTGVTTYRDGTTITIKWNQVESASGYEVYSSTDKNQLLSYTLEADVSGDTTEIKVNNTDSKKNYYFRVRAYCVDKDEKSYGAYSEIAEAKISLGSVKNLKAEADGKNRVRLSWEKLNEAEGYLIYKQDTTGKFSYIAMTGSQQYTDKNASDKEENIYKVYPYCMDGVTRILGTCESSVSAKGICRKVENIKVISSIGIVTVTWDAVDTAEGYLVYGKRGNGAYGYLGMTTKTTQFVDQSAPTDEYSFYWIYPYFYNQSGERIIGEKADYVYGKPQKCKSVTNVKVSSAIGEIKLTWSASQNADGYIIYKKEGQGGYGYAGMTSGTQYVDKEASAEEYNFYWIYPYYYALSGERVITTTSDYVYGKAQKCKAVTNIKVSSIVGGVKLNWQESTGADGYLIYGKTNSTAYGYVGMTSGTQYTDKAASLEEYNFYWIYPYYMQSGKRVITTTPDYVYGKAQKCKAVTNIKVSSMSGGVKLTWNVSEGADGYLIYGKTNSTAYGYVGMTSGTQYIDKAAPAEEYKFYWIYPYYYNQSGKRIITTTPDYVYGKAAK